MTIEFAPSVAPIPTPSAPPAKAAPANEASATKDKSDTPEKSKSSDSKDFMAILAALGDSEGPAVGADGVADDLVTNPVTDLALDAKCCDPAADAASLLNQAMQWAMPGGDPNAIDKEGARQHPTMSGVTSVQKAATDASDLAQRGALQGRGGPELQPKANHAAAHRKGAGDVMTTSALQNLPEDSALSGKSGDAAPVDARDAKLVVAQMTANTTPPKQEPIAPLLGAAMEAKRQEQKIGDSATKSHAVHDVPGVSNSPAWVGNPLASTTSVAPDGAVSAASYVAEKISYWISNDVQKAEMKLDGLGDKAIEVSISMNGNQAHVVFRTDELQAREALQGAGAELREMLQRDGVVLSGMSVGTSSSGASNTGGQSDRNARQGNTRVTAMVEQPARLDRVVANRTSVGRALDLFV